MSQNTVGYKWIYHREGPDIFFKLMSGVRGSLNHLKRAIIGPTLNAGLAAL